MTVTQPRPSSEVQLRFYKIKRNIFSWWDTENIDDMSVNLLFLYSHELIHRRRVIRILKTTVFRRSTRSPVTIRDTKFTIGSEDNNIAKLYYAEDLQPHIYKQSSWYEPGCRASSQRTDPSSSSETHREDQREPHTNPITVRSLRIVEQSSSGGPWSYSTRNHCCHSFVIDRIQQIDFVILNYLLAPSGQLLSSSTPLVMKATWLKRESCEIRTASVCLKNVLFRSWWNLLKPVARHTLVFPCVSL